MRQVVIVIPSAFTLGNMFFGMWAIVSAYRGNFLWAAWFVVFAGVLDMLDGRVARLSGTGTKFGAELDSLVDCISFGVAPAMIMFFLEFQNGREVRLAGLLHVRGRGGRPAGALQRAARHRQAGVVHRDALALGGDDAGGLLPLQPDPLVPRSRWPISTSSAKGSPS